MDHQLIVKPKQNLPFWCTALKPRDPIQHHQNGTNWLCVSPGEMQYKVQDIRFLPHVQSEAKY